MVSKQPFVSIVIVNFNGKKLMKSCLDSLLKIDYPRNRFEIIVVDNASSDGSVAFIKNRYKKITIIENKINNYTQACNLGILSSRGKYVVLLNNDVTVTKRWLLELIKVIEDDTSIGAVTSKLLKENDTIQNAGLSELPNFYWNERGAGKKAREYNTIAEVDAISGTCVLYRRASLNKVGLLDEDFGMFGEDVDLSIRLKKKGWKLICVPSSVAYHKMHGSCDERFAREAIEKNRLLLIAKHYPYKLTSSLIGNQYFVVNEAKQKSGRLFDILPQIFLKLTKEHNQAVANQVIKKVFIELRRITNYENKKLEETVIGKNKFIEDLKQKIYFIQKELLKTKEGADNQSIQLNQKDFVLRNKDLYIKNLSHEIKVFKEKDTNLSNQLKRKERTLEKEISTFSDKLKEKDDIISEKAGCIEKLTQKHNAIINQCQTLREEIINLNNKLKEKEYTMMDKVHYIEGLLQQLDVTTKDLRSHKEEITVLSEKLKDILGAGLEKDGKIAHLSEEVAILQQSLQSHQEEISNLSDRLKESLDSGLIKDNSILEKKQRIEELSGQLNSLQQDLESHKDEISNLSDRLKESLDSGLIKDNSILEKKQRIEELSGQLNSLQQDLESHKDEISNLTNKFKDSLEERLKLEKELNGIYASEGFRFILNPLWKLVWFSRLTIQKLVKVGCNLIWGIAVILISPFIILLTSLFFLVEKIMWNIFGRLLGFSREERSIVPFKELTVSIVIPDWNGLELLKKCLASIYEADEFKDGGHEVLVVDDASEYDIAEAIKDDFPKVRVIRNSRNLGFGRTCNRGVREARGELIVLLNNDIMVSKNFLEPLKRHFMDPRVFAVSPKLYYWDMKTFNYGVHMGKFFNGYLNLWNESETGNGDKVSEVSPTIFAVGGAMCFRKRDFLWLGGFDDIYRPNCYEDIDISYRAQKRGLKVLYEPQSLLYHKAGATLNYLRHKEIKNELLFMWKNITDRGMLLSHLNHLPIYFFRGKHSSGMTFFTGYSWALNYLPQAMINKFRERRYLKVSDKTILNKCILYYRNFMRNKYSHPQKKTVLLITPFIIYPLNAGGKLRIYNLYKRLSKEYNLILLCLIHNEKEAEHANQLKDLFSEVHTVHAKTPANEFLFPERYRYSFSSFLIEKLKDIQDRTPVDIVHIESNELLYLSKYIKYIPIIYTEHDISILSYQNSYYLKSAHELLSGFIDYLKLVCYHGAAYRRIHRVITLSQEDEKVIKAFSPQADISLVPTGVDLKHFYFSRKTGIKKSLVFVGHYPHYPNEEAAVYFCRSIFPLIRNVIPEVTIKLIGSSPTEEIIKLVEIEGVEVVGTVPDVNPYLQDASCFVTAFKKGSGIRGKVLEAMAAGTPVISTIRGAYGINAVNGKHILIAERPEDFAKNVIRLLQDDELYKYIADNARILVEEQYDWDKIADKLNSIYKEVTGDNEALEAFSLPKQACQTEAEEKPAVFAIEDTREIPAPAFSDADRSLVQNIIEKTDNIIGVSLEYLEKDSGSRADGAQIDLSPEELHIELTHLCNSRCITCDIWDAHQRNNKTINDELSLDEIRSFIAKSRKLQGIRTVVLSGGEPFLRPDFVDICLSIKEILPHASLGVLTNGINTEDIISKTREILSRGQFDSLWIGSSLDGLGEAYDRIRGVKGGFDRFARTIDSFRKEFPHISFSTTFVLTPFNRDELIPCLDFAEKHGLDFFAQFGVPKQARPEEVFRWEEKDLIIIQEYIVQIIKGLITKTADLGHFNDSLSSVKDKINLLTKIYYWAHLVDFQRNQKRFFSRCDAAGKFAMFDPYGNMFFCPILKEKTIGNIRLKNLDELWISGEAAGVREFINCGKCACWLVCTVFPIVSDALALYGDRAAEELSRKGGASESGHENKRVNETNPAGRIAVVSAFESIGGDKRRSPLITGGLKSNIELNNEEFRERKVMLESIPQGVTIGANYKCNANCVFCLGGEYKPFSLKLYKKYFEKQLGNMIRGAEHVSLCGMGELLLIPDIKNFLEYINLTLPDKNKIITTNGLALKGNLTDIVTESKYSIQISLHASNALLHEQLTGLKGGFERIIEQVRSIVAKRKNNRSPYITLVFLINTMNIEDLPNFIELAASLGVDCVQCNYLTIFESAHLKLSCFFMQQATNEILDKAMERAEKLGIPLKIPPKFAAKDYFKATCSEPWKNIYVDTEGAVLPCCYSGEHFGELKDDGIISIWNNSNFQRIRADLNSGNAIAMCKYCLNNNPANVNLLNAHVSFRPDVQKMILN